MITIDIWSDIACPYCYIGKKHLLEAVESLSFKKDIALYYRSFELDPNAVYQAGQTIYDNLQYKYGVTLQQAKQMVQRVCQIGQKAGINFDFDRLIPVNTFDAHRLIHFAASQHKADAMVDVLFDAFFTLSKNISDHDELALLGESIGLSDQKIKQMLVSEQYKQAVWEDEQQARQIKIQSVPFFIINQETALSGALSVEQFVDTLTQIYDRQQPTVISSDATCHEGECKL